MSAPGISNVYENKTDNSQTIEEFVDGKLVKRTINAKISTTVEKSTASYGDDAMVSAMIRRFQEKMSITDKPELLALPAPKPTVVVEAKKGECTRGACKFAKPHTVYDVGCIVFPQKNLVAEAKYDGAMPCPYSGCGKTYALDGCSHMAQDQKVVDENKKLKGPAAFHKAAALTNGKAKAKATATSIVEAAAAAEDGKRDSMPPPTRSSSTAAHLGPMPALFPPKPAAEPLSV